MGTIKDFRIKGLVAATFTPFNQDGSVNLGKIEPYAEHLKNSGIQTIFVNGSTGESLSLTIEERKLLAERWCEVSKAKPGIEKVVIHVGTNCLPESKDLASHAQAIGAQAISVMPPVFFKPSTIDILVEYCKEVAAAAPNLPFYYYHIPTMTGVTFDMKIYLEKAAPEIPTLRGIKYSSADLVMANQIFIHENNKYNILYGVDPQLLSAYVMGIDAAIGSTYNHMAPIYQRMIAAFNKGDLETARMEQTRVQDVLKVVLTCGQGEVGNKALMKVVGVDCGPSRLPKQGLSTEEFLKMEKEVKSIGFMDWL